MLHAPIGPVTKSVAVYLRYRIGMTYRKVAEVFKDLFGLEFVPLQRWGLTQALTRGAPLYEDLREKIRASKSSMPMKHRGEMTVEVIMRGMQETVILPSFILTVTVQQKWPRRSLGTTSTAR